MPRTFQARLTIAFVGVVALTLTLTSLLVVKQLSEYLADQEQRNLAARSAAVANILKVFLEREAEPEPVVGPDDVVNDRAASLLRNRVFAQQLADRIAQANVSLRIGSLTTDSAGRVVLVPAPNGTYNVPLEAEPEPGQARDPLPPQPAIFRVQDNPLFEWDVEVTLSDPYTVRAATMSAVFWLLFAIGIAALAVAIVVATAVARRFTTPLRRLTEASRALAEGDLTRRVPDDLATAGATEIAALSRQFNTMAARLQESVEIIRRDRDTSRDFLADVSHELRTPLAALRTFNELLKERAGDDPEAREEFLEQSGQQIDRLDWLAQNLLELSKLDSGLLQLDLRPEDLRGCVESAVEQAAVAAQKRGVELTLRMPDRPIRIRHDPQRVGQVVSNLIGNALKFTPRGGSVGVEIRPHRDGAQIEVRDTGVGVDASELPRIFDRFYRGSLANEARGSGSGLGLAIVKSIVDMHRGRVAVESRLGGGSSFSVILPRDPRAEELVVAPELRSVEGGAAPASTLPEADVGLGAGAVTIVAAPKPSVGGVTDDAAARLKTTGAADVSGAGSRRGRAFRLPTRKKPAEVDSRDRSGS